MQKDLISMVKKLDVNCEYIIDGGSNQLVKINEDNYSKIINNLNVEIVKKYEIEDRLIIEGYTKELNDYKVINNQKINIQMSITENEILIGYPLIYNSF